MIGRKGVDTLDVGSGDDTLTVGTGDDIFLFDASYRNDTVNDFTARAATVIQLDADDSVTLLGVNVGDLHADDSLI